MSLATGIAVTVGDVLVLVVTWTKTGQTYFAAQKLPIKAHVATILLRDGEMTSLNSSMLQWKGLALNDD